MVTWWSQAAASRTFRSMKSKAESGPLPVAGSADAPAADDVERERDVEGDRLVISLEHTRWRHFGWAIFGIIGGALLIWKMGTVAQWIGVGLIGLGVWSTYHFIRTLVFE